MKWRSPLDTEKRKSISIGCIGISLPRRGHSDRGFERLLTVESQNEDDCSVASAGPRLRNCAEAEPAQTRYHVRNRQTTMEVLSGFGHTILPINRMEIEYLRDIFEDVLRESVVRDGFERDGKLIYFGRSFRIILCPTSHTNPPSASRH
jgi:hypothetical protein